MKTLLLAGMALAIGSTVTANAFTAAPLPQTDGQVALECSVVSQVPPDWREPDPVYKTNIVLNTTNGFFESFDVVHTVRSGATYDRTLQYGGASIWKTANKMEWYWKGYRGRTGMMVGEVYWNTRDGWMYQENIYNSDRLQTQILFDCHQG